VLLQNQAGLRLDDSQQIDVLDELSVLLALVGRERSAVRLAGKLIDSRLRGLIEPCIDNPSRHLGRQTISHRLQHSLGNACCAHTVILLHAAGQTRQVVKRFVG